MGRTARPPLTWKQRLGLDYFSKRKMLHETFKEIESYHERHIPAPHGLMAEMHFKSKDLDDAFRRWMRNWIIFWAVWVVVAIISIVAKG